MVESKNILSVVRFLDLEKWSVDLSTHNFFSSTTRMHRLSKFMRRIKDVVIVEDVKEYKRITVKLYGKGVIERDKAYGKDIGTKRQFKAKTGQLVISRIDARNGAFGIIPAELDGAIVTNDFWLFDVFGADVKFLILVLSSPRFQAYWKGKSNGTTNRQRVDESDFLSCKIPIFDVSKQHELVNKYEYSVSQAEACETEIARLDASIEEYLHEELGTKQMQYAKTNSALATTRFKDLTSRWEWDTLSLTIKQSLESCVYPIAAVGNKLSLVTRSWNKKSADGSFDYIEIGGIDPLLNTIRSNETQIAKAPSRATQIVKTGDLIIGTTRPYLKKFAIVTEENNNNIASSGFQVIEQSKTYNLLYILEVFKSQIAIKQFEQLMTGALYPAINFEQLKMIRVPFPPIEVQNKIVNHISEIKEQINTLRQKAESLRSLAKREFENAVFSE